MDMSLTTVIETLYRNNGGQSIVVSFLKRWFKSVLEMFTSVQDSTNVQCTFDHAVDWKNSMHWHILQGVAASVGDSGNTWKHPTNGCRVVTWERPLTRIFNEAWRTVVKATDFSRCHFVSMLMSPCLIQGQLQ